MPNLYVPPQTQFASAAHGFLGSFQDFRKLNLEQQRTASDIENQRARSGQIDKELGLREQGLEMDMQRETRLSQGPPPIPQELIDGIDDIEQYDAGRAKMLRALAATGNISPEDLYAETGRIRDSGVTKQVQWEEWGKALDEMDRTLEELTTEQEGKDGKKLGILVPDSAELLALKLQKQQIRNEYEAGTGGGGKTYKPPTGDAAPFKAEWLKNLHKLATSKISPLMMAGQVPQETVQQDQPGESKPSGVQEKEQEQEILAVEWVRQNQEATTGLLEAARTSKSLKDFEAAILKVMGDEEIPDEVLLRILAVREREQRKGKRKGLQDLKPTGGANSRLD